MARVAVVGAGVVGLSCAWYLRQDGHEVLVVDRGTPEDGRCSVGNAGIIVPSHFVPLAAPGMVGLGLKMALSRTSAFRIRPVPDQELAKWCWLFARNCTRQHVERSSELLLDLHLESRRLHQELAEHLPKPTHFRTSGMITVCEGSGELESESKAAEEAARLGLKPEPLDESALRKLEPELDVKAAGGFYYPEDAHVSPTALAAALVAGCEAAGVTFRWGEEAALSVSGRTATLQGWPSDRVVLAAGAWSGRCARSIGLSLPVQPGRGLSVDLPAAPRPRHPLLVKRARSAVAAMPEATRVSGTMELGVWNLKPDWRRTKALFAQTRACLRAFCEADFQGQPVWTGLRPCSPDGLPFIGPTAKSDNVLFATGHGMMGVSLGPVTGRMVADLVSGKVQPVVPLSPDRFDR